MNENWEKICAFCENGHKIDGGAYYICQKKGVVAPDFSCRRFCFDPLKIEMSPARLPSYPPDAVLK